MRAVIVTGGRDGHGLITAVAMAKSQQVIGLPRYDMVVVGSNRGTDGEAVEWALAREMPITIFPAKWTTGAATGPKEGPIRNRAMFDAFANVVAVLAFIGGRGTSDMVGVASGRVPIWFWEGKTWVRLS